MLLALPDIPLRSAPFSLADRCLLWSQARLYADRLTLYGWGLWGRYWCKIPYEAIDQVTHDSRRLHLHLDGNQTLSLQMTDAARWQTAIQAHRDVYDH